METTGSQKNGCPYCLNKKVLKGFNDLESSRHDLMDEWDYEKNTLDPSEIVAGCNKSAYWICKKGHSWKARIVNRSRGSGCPYCAGQKVLSGDNDLATLAPKLAQEWYHGGGSRNGFYRPSDLRTLIIESTDMVRGIIEGGNQLCPDRHWPREKTVVISAGTAVSSSTAGLRLRR